MGEGGSFRKSYISCVLLLIRCFSCVCALDFSFFSIATLLGQGSYPKKIQTGGGGVVLLGGVSLT